MNWIMNYLKQWSFIRALRLFIGVTILINGIHSSETAVMLFGGFFTLLPLLNYGCSPGGTCTPTISSKKEEQEKEISYEEVL